MSGATVASVVRESLARHAPAHRARFRFGDYTVEVASNSAPLLDALREYYREFSDHPGPVAVTLTVIEGELPALPGIELFEQAREPGKLLKERYANLPDGRVVLKVRTGMMFVFGSGHHLAVGPAHENVPQVVNFVNNRFMQRLLDEGAIVGHCAGVVAGGRALALAGFSGMGKSTLALHAMDADDELAFLSNDRILFRAGDDGVRIWGVPKHPRINPGTALNNPRLSGILDEHDRARFSRLPPDQLWEVEHKYDALVHRCFGPGRFVLQAGFAALAILNWRRGAGALVVEQVDLAQRRDLLPALMKSPGVFFLDAEGNPRREFGEPAYLHALARVRVFELSGGVDFVAGTRAVLGLVHGSG